MAAIAGAQENIYDEYFSELSYDELVSLAAERGISTEKEGLKSRLTEYESYPTRRESMIITPKKPDDVSDEETLPKRKSRSATPCPKKSSNQSAHKIPSVDTATKVGPIGHFPNVLKAGIALSLVLGLYAAMQTIKSTN